MPATKYFRWLSLFVSLCDRNLLPGNDGEMSTDVFCRCLPVGTPFYEQLFLVTCFLSLFPYLFPSNEHLSAVLPLVSAISSPQPWLSFVLPCTCNLAKLPPVLFQISCQNSLGAMHINIKSFFLKIKNSGLKKKLHTCKHII